MSGPDLARGIALSALATLTTLAAAPFTEDFATGLNGWTNNVDATKWTASTQAVRVSFGPGVLPQNAALEATAAASGGAFCGDYRAAGVEAIGFSFFAESVLPSVLKIEVRGGTNVFFQDLRPRMTAAGVWQQFLIPLTDREADRWSGAPATLLPDARTNIVRVAIRVTTSGTAAQAYRMDDVFLDTLPVCRAATGTTAALESLRTNFVYRLETAESLTNTWTTALTFTATNRFETKALTNTASPLFLRLQN